MDADLRSAGRCKVTILYEPRTGFIYSREFFEKDLFCENVRQDQPEEKKNPPPLPGTKPSRHFQP